jgi:phage tail protein X
MTPRYIVTPIIKDANEKRRLASTIIPVQPAGSNDTYIQTTTVERLDLLAYKFYNNASLWYVIAAANGLGKGSYYVPPGSRLRIPDALTIQQTIEQINASR